MAKETVTRCDVALTVKPKPCGEIHSDTRTFKISLDGETWEVDLGGAHAESLLAIARMGRHRVENHGTLGSLEGRIRGSQAADV